MLLFALDSAARSSAWQLRGERWERIGQVPPRLSDATCTADMASERITLVGRAPGSPELATYLLLR